MSIATILLPLFVQVALTLVLMLWMGRLRTGLIKRREVKMADIALGEQAWPAPIRQISNCYRSQFELPVLFYVLTVLAIVTRHADLLFVSLAWIFVTTRLVHAFIHTGTNYVPYRFYAFLAGLIVLAAMWIIFAVDILLGLP